jgi:hypothetical protein
VWKANREASCRAGCRSTRRDAANKLRHGRDARRNVVTNRLRPNRRAAGRGHITRCARDPFAVSEALSAAARAQFTDGLIAETNHRIDNKCIPVGIVAWIITMIAVARFSIPEFGQGWGAGIGLVMAFVVAGIVTKIMHVFLEDKWVRPIAGLSDEMLVNRYNEAKADRRAARTRTAISWAVIAIIVVLLIIAWTAAQRH